MKFFLAFCVSISTFVAPSFAADEFTQPTWLDLTPVEKTSLESPKMQDNPLRFTPYDTQRAREPKRHQIFLDRREYLADEAVGQALITFIGEKSLEKGKLVVEIAKGADGAGGAALTKTFEPLQTSKLALLFATGSLAPGEYQFRAKLEGVEGTMPIKPWTFRKSDKSNRVVEFPKDGVPLRVLEQKHIASVQWPVTTGIPLPRHCADSTDEFALMEDGKPVAAQFSTRGTWYPDGKSIEWLGLDFLAKYDNSKAHEYRLMKIAKPQAAGAQTGLKVSQTSDLVTVENGKIRFVVNRRAFNGIQQVWLLGADGKPAGDALINSTDGIGGPFLFDERGYKFEASNDEAVRVELEESGPVRATISASGWYTSGLKNEKLCLFQTRISAYAGQPWVNVSHRTVLTYDTDKQKLGGLGFVFNHAPATDWQFGADGAALDGKFTAPPAPAAGAAKKPAEQESTVWLHQDRSNHFRLAGDDEKKPIAQGKRSDGWMIAKTANGASVSIVLREPWQLYPKELEVGPETMAVHFWPKHGHDTYTDDEELTRSTLYKYFYAHEGLFLDIKFPQKYYEAMRTLGPFPMLENQGINALTGNGQGLAISNDFAVRFDAAPVDTKESIARANLYQQNSHAIADPAWNGASGTWGRYAAQDLKKFPQVEYCLEDGYRQNTTTPEICEEYGMWIWPDTHNNWSPVAKTCEWHRFWNLGHYQNVWESWLLYLRSGSPWTIEWARRNTRHYMDVGTVNYDDPRFPLLGHIAGAMYHTKGFTPWGSPRDLQQAGDDYVEVGAHFINPAAFLAAWQVMGDRIGKQLVETWGHVAVNRVSLPPERSRECNTTLGELMAYYIATWDPQALVHITDLAEEHMSRPMVEIPAGSAHPVFNPQWVRRYWEQTRDPRLKAAILAYEAEGDTWDHYQIDALCYEWTGDKKWLTRHFAGVGGAWQYHYNNPADPLNGYGPRLGSLGSGSFAQKAPYYLQGLIDAGIDSIPADAQTPSPIAAAQTLDKPGLFGLPRAPGGYGPLIAYLLPAGANPSATIEVEATISDANGLLPKSTGTTYVRVDDASGKVLLETTVLGGSLRPTASVALDPRKDKAPFRLYTTGTPANWKWSGSAEKLNLAPKSDDPALSGK